MAIKRETPTAGRAAPVRAPTAADGLNPFLAEIPEGSVVGLNYSGMHDSAIAIVSPDGTPLYAGALERYSRVKQDGRPPFDMLDQIPWARVSKVAVSTDQAFSFPEPADSRLLTARLPEPRTDGLRHGQPFYDVLDSIPCEKEFVCHQLAHAASAFWGSGFDEALCMTYDGGMANSPWFGGLYKADRVNGPVALDRFSALHYAKISSLYTFVTALLGFTPNKHEGKITGLAAYGKATKACRALLMGWFEQDYLKLESVMEWAFVYDRQNVPQLLTNDARIAAFRKAAEPFSREDLAATVQALAEEHVLDILAKVRELGWAGDNICLAGGLFANVKINQRVVESGFTGLFVAPPMTDDGTALGAAWQVLSLRPDFAPPRISSMYLGEAKRESNLKKILADDGIVFSSPKRPARAIAELLAKGAVVAVFQGRMEFGPRALGNRSILAQATDHDINNSLNSRLNRTEFMPFAPVTRHEDAADCYIGIDLVRHAAEFMTVTVNCTDEMKAGCPAVVHVDGTARPQLVSADSNPVVYEILSDYKKLTSLKALVNTSFNIHEEPIICSVQDALKGFFESGLDHLYLGGGILISFAENQPAAVKYLQKRLLDPGQKARNLAAINQWQSQRLAAAMDALPEKERVIQTLIATNEDLTASTEELRHLQEQFSTAIDVLRADLEERNALIQDLYVAMRARRLFGTIPGFRYVMRLLRRMIDLIWPRLGNFYQYYPKNLKRRETDPRHTNRRAALLERFLPRVRFLSPSQIGAAADLEVKVPPRSRPKISIVTPSFKQGDFIEKTLLSILDQNYPNLEYFVQDGGSPDNTTEVLRQYEDRLSGWVSEKDTGQSQAINRGFVRTTGDIMAWVNSDDLLMPGVLEAVADYFTSHPDVDVVYGNRLMVDENDGEIGRWVMPAHDDRALLYADFIPQETMFWRRSIWDKAGGQIDETFRFAMDWDLLLRFRAAGATFAHIPAFLGAFRIHPHQKTSSVLDQIGFMEMNLLRERSFGRVPDRPEIRKSLKWFMVRHVLADMRCRIAERFQGIK